MDRILVSISQIRFVAFFFCVVLQAQIAPPNQDFVTAIGNSPLKAPANADFTPGTTFTMEGWIYLTGKNPGTWIIGKGLNSAGIDPFLSFALTMSGDGTALQFAYSSGGAGTFRAITAPAALPLRTWTHIAAVMDGGATRLLVNGSVVATGTSVGAPLAAPSVPFSVGLAYLPNGSTNYGPFPGVARQVRFWNTARTTAQIAGALSESVPSERTGLVAAWPLDESAGTTARDISGNGRPLTGSSQVSAIQPSLLAAGPFFEVGTNIFSLGSVFTDGPFFILDIVPIDFDSDGDLDLILLGGGAQTYPETRYPMRAFRNDGGRFVDVTTRVLGNATVGTPTYEKYVGDLNGDGRPDLLIGAFGTDTAPFPGGQMRIYIQTADGRLVDETATRLPQRLLNTHAMTVADIDGNGSPDIYLANTRGEGSNLLKGGAPGPLIYQNDGRGFFTEAKGRLPTDIANGLLGLSGPVFSTGLFTDVNGDGHPDLILGGNSEAALLVPNEVLINDGRGYFSRDSRFVLPPKLYANDSSSSVTGITAVDFDGDGRVDLLLSENKGYAPGWGRLQLLSNRGNGIFVDVTADAGLVWRAEDKQVSWVRIADLNQDGRPDIVALVSMSSRMDARIFLNRGGNRFAEVTAATLPHSATDQIQVGDFDGDGKPDLVTATPTAMTVARNLKPLALDTFNPAPSRLANLSVLSNVTSGDPMFTLGTVVGGAGTSGTSSLLVRAVGPSLTPFGVDGALTDPTFDVFAGSAIVAANNNWGGASALNTLFTRVGAFPYLSGASLDAATTYTPTVTGSPAGLTVQVSGVGGATGKVLAEIYDTTTAPTAATPRLINISVLKQIDVGAILTAGFVIQGPLPKQVLVRAVGPTLALAPFGVGGTMSDPKLDLFLGQNVIASNDNWGGTAALTSAFSSVGAFALGTASKDAALLVTLFPGSYTVQMSGVGGLAGLALVEVYELP